MEYLSKSKASHLTHEVIELFFSPLIFTFIAISLHLEILLVALILHCLLACASVLLIDLLVLLLLVRSHTILGLWLWLFVVCRWLCDLLLSWLYYRRWTHSVGWNILLKYLSLRIVRVDTSQFYGCYLLSSGIQTSSIVHLICDSFLCFPLAPFCDSDTNLSTYLILSSSCACCLHLITLILLHISLSILLLVLILLVIIVCIHVILSSCLHVISPIILTLIVVLLTKC